METIKVCRKHLLSAYLYGKNFPNEIDTKTKEELELYPRDLTLHGFKIKNIGEHLDGARMESYIRGLKTRDITDIKYCEICSYIDRDAIENVIKNHKGLSLEKRWLAPLEMILESLEEEDENNNN